MQDSTHSLQMASGSSCAKVTTGCRRKGELCKKNTVHIYCVSLLEECMELKIFTSGKSNMP